VVDFKKIELFDENGRSRGYYDISNQINDLTGKEWIFSTKSVIPKSFPSSFQHKLRNKHGGQKPPELCEMIIRTFTKEGAIVLDPFCGVGGTLLGCHLSQRKGIGIEINKNWVEIYKRVCQLENIRPEKMINGDSKRILQQMLKKDKSQVDLVLTDVPYWKMDEVEKSKGRYKKVGKPAGDIFSEKSKLSRFNHEKSGSETEKEEWEALMEDVFNKCYDLLKPGCYCAVFIGNMYHGGHYYLLNADIVQILSKIGFVLKGEIIWYDVSKNLHLYGINYSWIPSLVHQFIMIFRKEREKKLTREEIEEIREYNLERVEKISKEQLKKGIDRFI